MAKINSGSEKPVEQNRAGSFDAFSTQFPSVFVRGSGEGGDGAEYRCPDTHTHTHTHRAQRPLPGWHCHLEGEA